MAPEVSSLTLPRTLVNTPSSLIHVPTLPMVGTWDINLHVFRHRMDGEHIADGAFKVLNHSIRSCAAFSPENGMKRN